MPTPSPESPLIPESLEDIRPTPDNLGFTQDPTRDEERAYNAGYASGQKVANFISSALLEEFKNEQIEQLRQESLIDPLTGISNRRKMEQTYFGLVTEHPARRRGETFPAFREKHTGIMIDLDYFRDVNNNEGHAAGDMVLKAVAEKINSIKRDRDELGRIGGDEIALFLARTTVEEGVVIAENIRAGLDELRIGPKGIRMTASIGVAELAHAETMEAGLKQADDAAYASKEAGRNRVTVYDPTLPPKGE